MIFLDTSAIYALADPRDPNHGSATSLFGRILEEPEEILVHNYVLVEAVALLQRRLGRAAALQFLYDAAEFQIHWVRPEDHQRAVQTLEHRGRRDLSLVDCVSFEIMGQYQVTEALAFDADFVKAGFVLYPKGSTP